MAYRRRVWGLMVCAVRMEAWRYDNLGIEKELGIFYCVGKNLVQTDLLCDFATGGQRAFTWSCS